MDLATFWFIVLGVLWTGYLVLEGFDFGVGMLLPVLGGKRYAADAEDAERRRLLINTIGPVWDGNEVWVLTAGGATFAAFPHWYATLFSGFYLPLLLILVALIVRNLGFEYRHKRPGAQWKARWDQAIFWGSLVPALLWGVALTNIVMGVPIDANKSTPATSSRCSTRSACSVDSSSSRCSSPTARSSSRSRRTGRCATRLDSSHSVSVLWPQLAPVMLLGWIGLADGKLASLDHDRHRRGGPAGRARRQPGRTRGLGLHRHGSHDRHGRRDVLHRALPERHAVDHQRGLTIENASSTDYTLKVMTIVALIFTPIVLIYQGWTYWVFGSA